MFTNIRRDIWFPLMESKTNIYFFLSQSGTMQKMIPALQSLLFLLVPIFAPKLLPCKRGLWNCLPGIMKEKRRQHYEKIKVWYAFDSVKIISTLFRGISIFGRSRQVTWRLLSRYLFLANFDISTFIEIICMYINLWKWLCK